MLEMEDEGLLPARPSSTPPGHGVRIAVVGGGLALLCLFVQFLVRPLTSDWLSPTSTRADKATSTRSLTQDLDWGMAFNLNPNVSQWPAVSMKYGSGTDTNMPRLPNMLDKALHFTLNLSAATCHNVVAFQAVDASMNDGCYCDGNGLQARPDNPYSPGNCTGPLNVANKPCVEIDFLEANTGVWATTLHDAVIPGGWKAGVAAGYGGPRAGLNAADYGPEKTIDTLRPFNVTIGFPTFNDILTGLEVTLAQESRRVRFRAGGAKLEGITHAVQRGLTPGFSYWSMNESIPWFDGYPTPSCEWQGEGEEVTFSNWQVLPLHQIV